MRAASVSGSFGGFLAGIRCPSCEHGRRTMNSQSHTRRDHSTMPALQGWTLTFLLLAFAIHLTACQSAPQRPVGNGTSEDQGLVAWTDEELAPYLAQRLAQHPRFKG